MNKVQDEKRAAVIAGLREMADWLEQNPQAPIPVILKFSCHVMGAEDGTDGRAQVEQAAELIGAPVAEAEDRIETTRMFGPIEYSVIYIDRAATAAWAALTSYDGAVQS